MQRKYAHTGQLKAWRTFPDNIQTISIWDDLCAIFLILTYHAVATTQCVANW